jgi:hypothetical protein
MFNLHLQDLRKSKTSDLLSIQETSLIIGGGKRGTTKKIEKSFNDVIYGGDGDDVIYSDPISLIDK